MSDELVARLARLRRKLAGEADPEERADLAAAIDALEQRLTAPPQVSLAGAQVGEMNVRDVAGGDITTIAPQTHQTISGEANVGAAIGHDVHGNVQTGGVAIGTVNIRLETTGPTLSDEERGLLARYLPAIQEQYRHLMLRNRVAPERTGNDERAVPELYLEEVYTTLTTDGPARIVVEAELTTARLRKRLAELQEQPATPDQVEPQDVRTLIYRPLARGAQARGRRAAMHNTLDDAAPVAWSADPLPDDAPARARYQVRELSLIHI